MWLPSSSLSLPRDITAPPHNEYAGQSAVVVSITFAAVATLVVAVRLWTRWRIVNNLGKDDLVITASVLVSIAMSGFIGDQVKHGLGRHESALTPEQFKAWLKRLWISIPLYNLTLTLTKISILLQYLRVFPGPPVRRMCYILMAFVVAAGMWTVLTAILTCIPVAYNWDRSIKGGRCLPLKPLWFANAALNIATDLSILAMPMPVLKTLKLPKRQKIGLYAVFALGGFVCITSILRLRSIYIASTSHDQTWDNTGAAAWSAVEVNTGIICAALPTIKPLLARIFPRLIPHSSYIQPSHSRGSKPAGIYRESNSRRTTAEASGIPMNASQFSKTWGNAGGIQVDFTLTQEVEKGAAQEVSGSAGSVVSAGSLGGTGASGSLGGTDRHSETDSENGLILKT